MDSAVHRYPAPRAPPRPHVAAAPYKPLDIFPATTAVTAAVTHGRGVKPGRPSLSRLADLPLLFRPVTNPAIPADGLAESPVTTTAGVRGPVDVLAALRARTLLDLSCMREFSLLRARPRPQRDLQQLSARSAYDVQAEQLRLQHELQQRQPQPQGIHAAARPVRAARRPHPRKVVEPRPTATPTPTSRTPRTPRLPSQPQPQPAAFHPPNRTAKPTSRRATRTATPTAAVTAQQGFLLEQDLPALMAATGYSRPELFARWARFKALCSLTPAARGVDKDTLRRGVPQLSVEDQLFVDRAFEVLDVDGSGALEWPEFVAALAALEKGDTTRRVELLFRAYDLNGDGFVQRHEAQQFFLASLLAPATADVVNEAHHFVAKMFLALGREQHDTICIEDALRYLREHPAADAYSLLGRTMVVPPPATPSSVETVDDPSDKHSTLD